MRDPHVVSLSYRLVATSDTTFSEQASPVEVTTGAFVALLHEGLLAVTMKGHHPSETSAREVVDPYLRAWEALHTVTVSRVPEFRFEFISAEMIDRDPPPPGKRHVVALAAGMNLQMNVSARFSVTRSAYPRPPADFVLDPDTLALWQRWNGYVDGREPLQAMAYFCLTALERHGRRSGAAIRYRISRGILDTIGRLSSEAGDASTARKASAAMGRPLTPTETAWVEAAVRAIVRRAGEVAAAPSASLPLLTMEALPPLESAE